MTIRRFPPGFFDRADQGSDDAFYRVPRLVTHIDDGAIAAVGALYDELGLDGDVLDLMSSWVSHFTSAPRHLTVLGMNAAELAREPAGGASGRARPQRRPGAAVRRRVVRRRRVLRVGRLPRAPGRGVPRRGPRAAPGRTVRVHVLESLLSDQGDPRLAARRPTSEHGEIVAEYFRRAGGCDEPVDRAPDTRRASGRPALGRVGPVGRLAR